ncbi:hypothetical protein DYB37_011660 [Aphanomyces astaci]|uniref:Domain of unknown function DB domain-containing protein n=1 Tax=Aphanomyces astaci TaxID=112090 RepID=A0A3L6UWT6_APHAT|nr:hypothetical protein DYB35_005452 [Aphanomyces astaci]RHZ29978.1 hypothetical protein DYB37_011660 [Aphanomyces astaci]RLO01061.1 hypothetical protein DYB28_003032 [Aphanomyces astaci]
MKLLLPTLAAMLVHQASATCLSTCNQHTLNAEEDLCTPYRDQLPRPTLYNFCVDAFRKGIVHASQIYGIPHMCACLAGRVGGQRACEEYCTNTGGADAVLGSLQAQSCDHLRTTRPKAALTICNKAFRTATTRAKAFVESGSIVEPPKQVAAAAAAPAAPVEVKPKQDAKPDIKIEPKKKSPLEAARDEAKLAFDTDASRLGEL